MIVNKIQPTSYGTDPVAGALRATFRSATFEPARRADDDAPSPSRAFDLDALYPNLAPPAPERPSILMLAARRLRASLATVRHAIASLSL